MSNYGDLAAQLGIAESQLDAAARQLHALDVLALCEAGGHSGFTPSDFCDPWLPCADCGCPDVCARKNAQEMRRYARLLVRASEILTELREAP